MATNATLKRPVGMASKAAVSVFRPTVRRAFLSSQRPVSLKCPGAPIRSSFPRLKLQQSFRRSYADNAPGTARRRAGFFRWTWRLIYLSAIGGVGYLGYAIYLLRTPHEQFEPDPSKKTLVILGMLWIWEAIEATDQVRHGLGICFSPQETRY